MSVVALRLIFGIVTIGELFEFIVASNPVAIFAIEKAWAVHPMVPIVSVGHNMGLRSVFFVTVLVTASALYNKKIIENWVILNYYVYKM